ncbi:hypothetical protein [Tessaracoccus sp. MC1756]|uniref:hypothetical protein n=1 Tax=Tessaracoccus sp. MC1756 TaxID=2760311 RepID=UPI001603B7AD|nr:hypothetical protein [Tessaracoccus sp. MC1756]MBB1509901.1 hypothetical protein [Tessaracoccus sp. MC1756]
MSLLRRTAIATAAAGLAISGLVTQPSNAADTTDVYATPGGHIQSGRLWDTECEMYSSNVVRCETKIWSTQVVYKNGRFVQDTDWHFNNLSYLPSPRSSWAGNPLATTGTFTSAGHRWRTECDTPATGRGGCRSYIETNFIAKEGNSYVRKTGFVFNNLVRFSGGSVAPVTAIPAHVLDQSTLTFEGLGPLTYAPYTQAAYNNAQLNYLRLGYIVPSPVEDCDAYRNGPELVDRGISVVDLADVAVREPGIQTEDGAEVGMTVAQIQAIYGADFKQVRKQNHGELQYLGSVRLGDRELQFRVQGEPYPGGDARYAPLTPMKGTDVIVEISAQKYTEDVSFGGC